MTFLALLTKELRLRMRRERTMWTIIIYLLLMGLLGWFFISRFTSYNNYGGNGLSQVGLQLYFLLAQVQLFLIIFITPAFTATTINGEKERQTFDLLLCSRLSSFSLISGKLVAGLANAFLLIAASAPLFSLVFFFGGVSPTQLLSALLIYIMTAIMLGTLGLFCSTIFTRPAVSTAITYMTSVVWIILPFVLSFILLTSGGSSTNQFLFAWNPAYALISTYTLGMPGYALNSITIAPWIFYCLLDAIATVLFFALSMRTVKPRSIGGWRKPGKVSKPVATA